MKYLGCQQVLCDHYIRVQARGFKQEKFKIRQISGKNKLFLPSLIILTITFGTKWNF